MNLFKFENLNDEQTEKIKNIIEANQETFYVDGDDLKPTDAYVHNVKLKPGIDIVHTKQYRIPHAQKEEFERQVNELEKKKIIEKSTSRFNSPAVLVKKPLREGQKQEFRLVIDYRKLNKATVLCNAPDG